MRAILNPCLAVIMADIRASLRYPGDILSGLSYFIMIATLIPLGLGADQGELARIAPVMIWIAVMLASLPQMDRLFSRIAKDGVLEQMLISPTPMTMLMLAKIIAAWLIIILPLVLAAPVIGIMFGLALDRLAMMLCFLAIGGLCLVMIGAMAAALVLGSRQSGVFTAIIVLPLSMPVLIFGVAGISALQSGADMAGHMMLLGALTLILLVLSPPVTAAAIRFSEE
ncbi:MAG TPA: heme exporter protein CcmB [Alphaproteobacteria bacterium]|mgnify:CR=1 FL=1|nr:heme exporter protein CcmB [Alphaproteobacteria bacterium]